MLRIKTWIRRKNPDVGLELVTFTQQNVDINSNLLIIHRLCTQGYESFDFNIRPLKLISEYRQQMNITLIDLSVSSLLCVYSTQ